MTRVLVVWEDDYWEPLGRIVKRLVRTAAPEPDAEIPAVLGHTTRSNGSFERYAGTTWPAVRPRGLPADPGGIDHLVCVVDGDRLHDLVPPDGPSATRRRRCGRRLARRGGAGLASPPSLQV